MPHLTSLPSLDSTASTRTCSSTVKSPHEPSAMNGDGVKAFSYLRDSAPKWLSDIEGLEQTIEAKQKEMAKGTHERPQLTRNNSVTSIREDVISDDAEGSPPRDNSPPLAVRRPNLIMTRLRNRSSAASTVASGVPKFRSRSMAIVYYDAEIQHAFEKLVREISMGRNSLRKGKMSARMEALTTELGDSSIRAAASGDMLPFAAPTFRRAGGRPPASSSSAPTTAPADGRTDDVLSAYDRADAALETAQRLCEKAAHQFLRDGDCRLETEGTKEAFQEVLKVSTEELPRLEALESARAPRVRTAPPKFEEPSATEERPATGLTFGSIEVDDSEDVTPLSMPELRMIRRAQRRNPA